MPQRRFFMRLAALPAALLLASVAPSNGRPVVINPTGLPVVLDEEFRSGLDVSANGPGTRWTAHTPWHGDFGDAAFSDPQPGFPFTVAGGVLRITMRTGQDHRWHSGLLSSSDPSRHGLLPPYGYYEMRAKFPAGPGVWPGFWLDSQPPPGSTDPSIEVDVVEHYGKFPGAFNSTVTVWPRVKGVKSRSVQHIQAVPPGTLSSGFHSYGAWIDPHWIIVTFDRKEIWRTPTPPEHRHGFDMLADLALGGGWPTKGAPDPAVMQIASLRAWALPASTRAMDDPNPAH